MRVNQWNPGSTVNAVYKSELVPTAPEPKTTGTTLPAHAQWELLVLYFHSTSPHCATNGDRGKFRRAAPQSLELVVVVQQRFVMTPSGTTGRHWQYFHRSQKQFLARGFIVGSDIPRSRTFGLCDFCHPSEFPQSDVGPLSSVRHCVCGLSPPPPRTETCCTRPCGGPCLV